MPAKTNPRWPVLTSYDQDHLLRIALPIGGIGTGTVSLGGRGDLRDWEIMNRPAKGFKPDRCFFALYAKAAGGAAVARVLEGPIAWPEYEGERGARTPNHGLPRFRRCSFHAAYPLAQVALSDHDVPLDARIEAFNPFIPPNAEDSGIPVAVLRFVLTNKSARTVTAAVCGTAPNIIGFDGANGSPKDNVNTFRKPSRAGWPQGLFMESKGVDPRAEQFGTMALTTTAASGVTYRTNWRTQSWSTDLLDLWDDFSGDGKLEDRPSLGPARPGPARETQTVRGALAVTVKVAPRATKAITFLLTWHFPNRRTWTPARKDNKPAGIATGSEAASSCGCGGPCGGDPDVVGNYYATQYRDAWEVAERTAADLRRLEADTIAFVKAFCDCDLPHAVKEAALFNLSTLRSQTCFRTRDGRFFGWEGCNDAHGCCHGSCTHVWNYEQATAFLFGGLSRSMREVEFLHATGDNGHMAFRVNLPLERVGDFAIAAADGQMGCLMKLYRDWQLSGDDEMLRALWPKARKAIEFCWIEGGWDADRDGVMEGCQHNTMDVEYFGPNGQMCGWYLGALRACEEMARHVGQSDFAVECRGLFERGRKWVDENLFNGEYYEQQVWPMKAEAIAPGLRHPSMGAVNLDNPEFQLETACLADQLVGQCMAHVCGLGYLLDPAHVQATLRTIMKHNFKKDLSGHFNNMRTYALNGESALLVATYPRGRRPEKPFPYFAEAWTGLEYTAAAGMFYEGQTANGLKCIEAVRDRYDGARRNPFDEPECGHHYARAMAAWAAVLALTGFHYSAVDGSMRLAAREGGHFWSTGHAWGTCRLKALRKGMSVELSVLKGALPLRRFVLTGRGEIILKTKKVFRAGQALSRIIRS